jgi:hypothetical protein
LKDVAFCAGHEVLMEVDVNILLIVGDPQGILGQQLRPRSITLLNIITLLVNYYKLQLIGLFYCYFNEDHSIRRQKRTPLKQQALSFSFCSTNRTPNFCVPLVACPPAYSPHDPKS